MDGTTVIRYFVPSAALLVCMLSGCMPAATDANPDAAGDALIDRYVGTWDLDELFAEPALAAELGALLGERLEHVMFALDVTGGIEYYGGGLLVSGNAPHAGGENEAIVCMQPFGADVQVHVGHYIDDTITLYTRQTRYDFLPTCIKDWVGLRNARHAHRLRQPANVRLQTAASRSATP
ncbi:MAG TPA: hypothetical protein VIL43_08320 [Burkholderiales bacterium]